MLAPCPMAGTFDAGWTMDQIRQFIDEAELAEVTNVVGVAALAGLVEGSGDKEMTVLPEPGTEAERGEPVVVPGFVTPDEQGAVVDSNVVTFPAGTTTEVRNAVSNWLLLAQRVATKKAPDKEKTQEWCDAYLDTLLQSGWVERENASAWTEESATGFTVHQKILELVAVVLGPVPTALAIVTAALTSLQGMSKDSPWITLFDRRGRSATAVGFQVANCETGDDGQPVLRAIDFRVHAEQSMTQVLFFKFTSRRARLYRRAVLLELPSDAIADYGPAIKQKVQDLVEANIAAFEL